MVQKKQNPGVQAGVSCNFSRQSQVLTPSISKAQHDQLCEAASIRSQHYRRKSCIGFVSIREASLTLLTTRPDLHRSEAGLCGHLCVTPAPTLRQIKRLASLLERYALPPLMMERV